MQFIGIFYPSPNQPLPWLVTELMHISLTSLIKKYEKCDFSIAFKLSILIDTCEGLQFLHSHSIIHRNLSSDNVLLTKHLVAKVTDLNMTKLIPSGREGQKRMQATNTEVFMPLEVLKDYKIHSTAVDVFSVGCICLHVISMQWPEPLAKQDSSEGYISEVKRRESYFTNFKDYPSLKGLVQKCLHDDSEHRPVMEEVYKCLKDIDRNHGSPENYFTDIVDLFRTYRQKLVEYESQLKQKDEVIVEKDRELAQKDLMLKQKNRTSQQKDENNVMIKSNSQLGKGEYLQ